MPDLIPPHSPSLNTPNGLPVIVVGGGLSGLSAARQLMKMGREFLVIEARDRVGGTIRSQEFKGFGIMDYGGSYIGPNQTHIRRVIEELALGGLLYKVYDKDKDVYFVRGKRYVTEQKFRPKFANSTVEKDVLTFFSLFEKYAAEVPLEKPWEAPRAHEWDYQTVKQFIVENCKTNECRDLGTWYIQVNMACEPFEISLLYALWIARQSEGLEHLTAVTGGAQEMKLLGGMQKLPEAMAASLKWRVKLKCPVVSITHGSTAVHVVCEDGRNFMGSHAILAMSPHLMTKIHFRPSVGSHRIQLQQRMPMGSAWKVQLYYKETFWRSMGFSGAIEIMSDQEDYVTSILDDSKPDCSCPSLTGFVVGDKARKFLNEKWETRRDNFVTTIAKAFNSTLAYNFTKYEEHNWMNDEYSGGCYSSLMPPGVLTTFKSVLSDPIGQIHYAGSDTATEWLGFMSGAIMAGERAAKEIIISEGANNTLSTKATAVDYCCAETNH
ncbi:amine oxidase [flavin-containing]-like [Varroa jacobsoni]|uniref:amine oxidase [flavin-containing]-like n=1 Tax=Varroa jacobsoni TaxID=62625 RepID=UPI000BF758C4|nr:amine oxidase [flavin-containing]-like [Varroa jacobsoni]